MSTLHDVVEAPAAPEATPIRSTYVPALVVPDAATADVAVPSVVGPAIIERPLVDVVPTSQRRRRIPRGVRRGLFLLAWIGLWQLLTEIGVIDATTLTPPTTIATTTWSLITDGSLPSAMLTSTQRVLIGLAIGATVGTVLGLISGLTHIGEDVIDAPLQMLRTVPFAGTIPLLILWLGIGETTKVSLVAIATVFPLYINVFAGIRNVDGTLVEAARTLRLSRLQLARHVVLPGALPQLLVGLRIAFGVAWLSLVFGELVNSTDGIGFLLNEAKELMRTDVMVVCLAVYAVLGLISDLVVRRLERVLLAWRPTFSGGSAR